MNNDLLKEAETADTSRLLEIAREVDDHFAKIAREHGGNNWYVKGCLRTSLMLALGEIE